MKGDNYYFTKEHENAIIEYNHSKDAARRSELYAKIIGPVLNELVDKIVYTFKFTTLPNIDSLKEECKIWLVTILDKYDEKEGYKAFAYFSVVTKNWFIHKVKKNKRAVKREIPYDDVRKALEPSHLSVENLYFPIREEEEFWSSFWTEVDSWEREPMKVNEKKVYEAMKYLLQNSEKIEIFNRKAIYLYIRELTGLNTKQIVSSLSNFRTKYSSWRHDWNNNEFL